MMFATQVELAFPNLLICCLIDEFSLGTMHCYDSLLFIIQVDRGVASPPDISMDITKLTQMLGIKPISFQDGVRATLAAEAST